MPRLDVLLTHTRALGARHAGYGVRAADYQTVGDALLAALAAVLGDSFDAPTRAGMDPRLQPRRRDHARRRRRGPDHRHLIAAPGFRFVSYGWNRHRPSETMFVWSPSTRMAVSSSMK